MADGGRHMKLHKPCRPAGLLSCVPTPVWNSAHCAARVGCGCFAVAVPLQCALRPKQLCGDGWCGDCPMLPGLHVPHRRAIPSAYGRLRTEHLATVWWGCRPASCDRPLR